MNPPENATKPLALLVEDDYSLQSVIKHTLERCGFEVDTAATSEEALFLFNKKAYIVIFMDIGLPGKDGAVTTQEIRKIESKNEDPAIFIIALTTHFCGEHRNYCLNMGIDDFLRKPVQEEDVFSIIKRYLAIQLKEKYADSFHNSHEIDVDMVVKAFGGNRKIAL